MASRWHFDVQPNYGPNYVNPGVGIRLTIADVAFALFLDFLLFEVMVQYDRQDAAQPGGSHE